MQGKRLEDEFDPIIVKEKYLTEKDERIRKIDVPERLQVFLFVLIMLNCIGLEKIMPRCNDLD